MKHRPWQRLLLSLLRREWAIGLPTAVAIFTALAEFKKLPYWIPLLFAIAVTVLILLAVILRFRRPQTYSTTVAPPSPKAYLRGLLPFEVGDTLLGRSSEKKQLITLIARPDFRFGFVSGDTGSGKTSLLRAGLITHLASNSKVHYIGDSTGDPLRAIVRTLGPEGIDDIKARRSTRQSAASQVDQYIILDQFEQFFKETRGAKRRANVLSDLLELTSSGVAILLALRREYVDYLEEALESIDTASSVERFRLSNWSENNALDVLTAAAAHDEVSFAPELQAAIVQDLSRDGEVRPVELQIIATELRRRQVNTLNQYRLLGGATHLLRSFVHDLAVSVGEQSIDLLQYVLRTLLDKHAESESRALTEDALISGISTISSRHLDQTVDILKMREILTRLEARYVIDRTADGRIFIRHEYVLPALQELAIELGDEKALATVNLESVIEARSLGYDAILTPKQLRLVRELVDPEVLSRSEAKASISASRSALSSSVVAIASSIAILVVAVATMVITTFGRPIEARAYPFDYLNAVTARDGSVVAFETAAGSWIFWQTNKPLANALGQRGEKFLSVKFSDDSSLVAGLTATGALYVWPAGSSPGRRPLATRVYLGGNSHPSTSNFIADQSVYFAISANDRFLMVSSPDGKVLLCPVQGHDKALLVAALKYSKPSWVHPLVAMSPNGSWLAINDVARKHPYLLSMKAPIRRINVGLNVDTLNVWDNQGLAFSPNSRWLAVANGSTVDVTKLPEQQTFRSANLGHVMVVGPWDMHFTNDNKWLTFSNVTSSLAPSLRSMLFVDKLFGATQPASLVRLENQRLPVFSDFVDAAYDRILLYGRDNTIGLTSVADAYKEPVPMQRTGVTEDIDGCVSPTFGGRAAVLVINYCRAIVLWNGKDKFSKLEPTEWYSDQAKSLYSPSEDELLSFGGPRIDLTTFGGRQNLRADLNCNPTSAFFSKDRHSIVAFCPSEVTVIRHPLGVGSIIVGYGRW